MAQRALLFLYGTLGLSSAISPQAVHSRAERPTCEVAASGDGSDDTSAILSAFEECGQGGNIIFSEDTTYNVGTVMNTTGLSHCDIDIYGTLLWSDDIDYWLDNSMPIGYQNQSTVWFLGGEGLTVRGHGTGTLDGNGQEWYDYVDGESNYPHRPMGLTIFNAEDSVFDGLRFVQSQMWTMAILQSQNILLSNIYVNSTSENDSPSRNTDGADTLFSDNITFRNWTVDNGDDAIALKANSTNILIEDSVFYSGQGFAIGSIGQYLGQYEVVENVVVRNVTVEETAYGAYIKTWTGEQVDYPPNGGGGGFGHIQNVTLTDFTLNTIESYPFSITQCTTFSGTSGDCDSSEFSISDISLSNFMGEGSTSYVAWMQCSKSAGDGGCGRIEIEDIEVKNTDPDDGESGMADTYRCENVLDPVGFECE